jgi:hypothetical protein
MGMEEQEFLQTAFHQAKLRTTSSQSHADFLQEAAFTKTSVSKIV